MNFDPRCRRVAGYRKTNTITRSNVQCNTLYLAARQYDHNIVNTQLEIVITQHFRHDFRANLIKTRNSPACFYIHVLHHHATPPFYYKCNIVVLVNEVYRGIIISICKQCMNKQKKKFKQNIDLLSIQLHGSLMLTVQDLNSMFHKLVTKVRLGCQVAE